jgi:hypothetical protein
VSMVGRNVLGLQPVGDGLIKDKFSLCFLYIYIPLCIFISEMYFMCILVGFFVHDTLFLSWMV